MIAGMMLYYDALIEYEDLTDDQFGRLIRAGLLFGKTGEETKLNIPEKYFYPGLKLKISRDQEKYRAVCEKRAEAARIRWGSQSSRDPDADQDDANACKRCQDKEKEKEKKKYQYQEKEKEKAQRRPSVQQYGQRDYEDEQAEAELRMMTEARKGLANEREEKGNRRRK